jgi:tetratricopeptide (TPR) repeat protein
MGAVYKARQVSLNRIVALKMILAGHLADAEQVRRFRTEAEQTANLDHPNIVPIYEVGEHDGQQYYTMRFVEGTSLADHPRSETRTEATCLTTVARAVHHAHQRGVLHRDLKPSNILMDAAGSPHVADFGLAKRLTSSDGPGADTTVSGAVVGTPRYMAPEQAAGRKGLSVAVDVFSLGVVLYERLTGRPPFMGESMLEVLRQVREDEPPRPSSLLPRLDRDLETICLKCLEKDAAKRYGSAEELAEELDRWLRGEPILARPVGQAQRLWRWCGRNPAVAGLAAGLVAALVAIATASAALALQARRLAATDRERADVERQGRQRAENAEQEADRERLRAENNLQAAREQRKRAEDNFGEAETQRMRADYNFHKTRQAIDRCFTVVSEGRLLDVAGAEPLRKELLAAALEYYRSFPTVESDDAEVQAELAAAYFRIAQIENLTGSDNWLPTLEKGSDILERLVSAGTPADKLKSFDCGVTDVAGQVVHLDPSITPRALMVFKRLTRTMEKLSVVLPSSVGVRNDLATVLSVLGYLKQAEADVLNSAGQSLAASRAVSESVAIQTRALELRQALATEHPGNARLRGAVVVQTTNVGRAKIGQRELGDAVRYIREAAELGEQLSREYPDNPRFYDDTAHAYLHMVVAQTAKRQIPDAVDAMRHWIAVRENLAARFPTVPAYQQALADCYSQALLFMQGGWEWLGWRLEPLLSGADSEEQYFFIAFEQYAEVKEKQDALLGKLGRKVELGNALAVAQQSLSRDSFPATTHLGVAGVGALEARFHNSTTAKRAELVATIAARAKDGKVAGNKTYRLAQVSLHWWAGELAVARDLLEALARELPDDPEIRRLVEQIRLAR